MLPLSISSPENKLESMTLVSLPKDFKEEKKKMRISYALVIKGLEDGMENAIMEVVKLVLEEFNKVVADDTLNSLPPLRNIKYQTDLVPGASLLNLPNY